MQKTHYKTTFLLASITYIKVGKTIIYFLKYYFFESKVDLNIIAFFIVVIMKNSKNIFFSTFKPYFTYGCITSNNKNIKVGVFSFAFFFQNLSLDFFQSLLDVFIFLKKLFTGLGS